jgi:tetratricopeptide (TPR) repeat protein
MERGQPKRAEAFARQLLQLDGARGETCELLAGILAQIGDQKAAIEMYARAADALVASGNEERARGIRQRHIPAEPFDLAAGDGSGPQQPRETAPGDSPFGEEGIGGEGPALDEEFRFDPDALEGGSTAGVVDELEVVDELAPTPKPSAPSPPRVAPPPTVVREAAPKPEPPKPAQPKASAPPAAPVAAAAKPAPAADLAADSAPDVDQLLAEAGVYLRYGKHERAVASLEALLARAPGHLAALEQLGEAHVRADAPARAVEVWTRAIEVAVAADEGARAGALRARIEALGFAAPDAAPPPQRANPAATVLFDAPAPDPPELDADSGAAGADDEIEIDVDADGFGAEPAADAAADDDEVEIDVDELAVDDDGAGAASETPEAEEPEADADALALAADAAAADSAEPTPDHWELPSDLGDEPTQDSDAAALELGEIDVEIDAAAPDEPAAAEDASATPEESFAPEPEPLAEAAVVETPAAVEPPPAPVTEAPALAAAAAPPAADAGDLSATTGQQIVEDLEEASFYFEQGLLDEAEAIYLRVVQRAPNHPGALLRLGEIAVARGQDPARGVADADAAPAAAAEPAVEAPPAPREEIHEVEPPDDLDLTAREFGPPSWGGDDESASDEVEAPAADPTPIGVDGAADLESTERAPAVAVVATPAVESVPVVVAPEPPPAPAVVEAAAPPASAPVAAAPAPVPAPAPLELTAPTAADDVGAPAFDLAAELSEALNVEAAPAARGASTDGDGFAALFSEFKKGVSRTLDEGDVETHFDLGIAYREMGLFDDAIGEFRYALGSSTRRLDALHMMGLCALDVGRATDAVGHLEQALASPDVPGAREAALRYDLGRAYEALDDRDRALAAFERVVELEADFQDAAQRAEALRTQSPEPPTAAAGEGEAYESFDDLIAQGAEDAAPEATPEPVAERYESFDEFLQEEGEPEAEQAGAAASEPVAEPIEAAPEPEPIAEPSASVEAEVAAAAEPVEAPAAPEVAPDPEPVAAPEPAPEAPPEKRRRRKISFF